MPDDSTATQIFNQVPWAVMKQHFSIQRWPPVLALVGPDARGAVKLVQNLMPGGLLHQIGELLETENPAIARGFLRVRVVVNTMNPLTTGCWPSREDTEETWVEFRYERLQDFCYRCGRIDHAKTECSLEPTQGGAARYGDWTRTAPITEMVEPQRYLTVSSDTRRRAGT